MSELIEQMNSPTSDVAGPNKIFAAPGVSVEAGDNGTPFKSHLQAATAAQQGTESHSAESDKSPDAVGVHQSQSEKSVTSVAKDQEQMRLELTAENNDAPVVSTLKSADSRRMATSDVVVADVDNPESIADSNLDGVGEGKLATAGADSNSTAPVPGKRIAVPAPDNGDLRVIANNSEGSGADLPSTLSEPVRAHNVAPSDLSSELDSALQSVTVTTSESVQLSTPELSSNPAADVSSETANLDAPTLLGVPVTAANTTMSQSLDVRQAASSAQNSLNTPAELKNPVGTVVAKDTSGIEKAHTGVLESSSTGHGRSGANATLAAAPVTPSQQPMQTAEVLSSVKNSQPIGNVDALSEAEVATPLQPRVVVADANVDTGKNNVTTTPALMSAVVASQRAADNVASTMPSSIRVGNRVAAGPDGPEAPVAAARDARQQQVGEAAIPANVNPANRMDAIAATASLQISSAEGDSVAGNQPSNMFLAASNGIVAAPNPARTTAGSSLVLAPTVMQMTPDFQDQALVGNVRWMVNEGISNATINVSPGGMGPISVQLTMEGEKMNVAFFAGQAATREALDMAAPRLRDHLQAQGHDQVRVEVSDSRSDNSRNLQQNQPGEKQGADARHKSEFENFADDSGDAVGVSAENPLPRSSSSLIDAFV